MPKQLTVISPQEGEVIFSENITVLTITSGCIQKIDCYLLFWFDEENPQKGNAIFHKTNTSFIFQKIIPGKHQLKVELVRKNGDSFSPKIIKEVNFITQAFQESPSPSPSPLITSQLNLEEDSSPLPQFSFFYPSLLLGAFLLIFGLWRFFK